MEYIESGYQQEYVFRKIVDFFEDKNKVNCVCYKESTYSYEFLIDKNKSKYDLLHDEFSELRKIVLEINNQSPFQVATILVDNLTYYLDNHSFISLSNYVRNRKLKRFMNT